MKSQSKERHFFFASLAGAAVLAGTILWPFATLILVAIAFSVALYPLYSLILRHTKNTSWLAALVTILLFLVVIGIPLYFAGVKVFVQSGALYTSITEDGTAHGAINAINTFLKDRVPVFASIDFNTLFGGAAAFLAGTLKSVLTTTIATVFAIVLALISVFYFLKDGAYWRRSIIRLSPLSDEHDERILSMLGKAIRGVMFGYILIALLQGALMGIGLWIFKVPNAALWGMLAGMASMIPSIGTALVSVPAIIYLFATGSAASGIGFMLWAIALVGGIDNILNPLIVGKKTQLSPIAVLFSVLGGVALLGAAGIIVGPLAISLLRTLIVIYQEDFDA